MGRAGCVPRGRRGDNADIVSDDSANLSLAAAGEASQPLPAHAVFEILVRQHADMLTAFLRTHVGRDDAAVDDLFQQAMLVAWRRLGDYDRSRPFAAWLRGIAHMLILEHARKRAARPACTDPAVLAELDLRFADVDRLPGDSYSDKLAALRACMERLPEAMREAVDLVYARGLLIASAAESVGATEEGMKKRVQRARQLLARCLLAGTDPAASP